MADRYVQPGSKIPRSYKPSKPSPANHTVTFRANLFNSSVRRSVTKVYCRLPAYLLYCERPTLKTVPAGIDFTTPADPLPLHTEFSRRLFAALRPWLVFVIVLGGLSLHPRFFSTFWRADYLPNILQQAATNIIIATGMTFVILTGGIDLSVGSVAGLCGVALGLTVTKGPPGFMVAAMALPVGVAAAALLRKRIDNRVVITVAAVAVTVVASIGLRQATLGGIRLESAVGAALLLGCACGLINGLLVSLGRVPAFIVTLGMLTAARGLTVYSTGGNSVSNLPPRLGAIGDGWPLIAIALSVVVAGSIILNLTKAGRYMSAIGGNEEAARLTGVDLTQYKTLAYFISGITAAVAAVVLTAKFQVASTNAATGAELNGIAAVVIGGTSLSGGRATVAGSLAGALTIAVLDAGLVLVGVEGTLQNVVIGAVIVVTVMIDQYRRGR